MTRRWNGWGDDGIATTIPRPAIGLLESIVGQGRTSPDALLADVVGAVPAGRLGAHPLLSTDPEDRVRIW
jgi:alkyldihydroxyacetonephosphate synthase